MKKSRFTEQQIVSILMADTLWNGRRFRMLNVLDEFNRETLRIEVDTACQRFVWCVP